MTGEPSDLDADVDPRLARITVYPVKSLDPHDVERARLVDGGALAGDREFALFDADGNYVNGKRERAVHRLRTDFDPGDGSTGGPRLTVEAPGWDGPVTVGLDDSDGRDRLCERLSDYFGYSVEIRRDRAGGFPDDTSASGPTVLSTATLREVASWYEGVTVDGMRRRLRANLEIEGVPAFWEDRLFDEPGRVVRFAVGDVTVDGVNPCQRCVVPGRDPDTGEETPGFRETFVARRAATLPEWSGGGRFDHPFRLMVNTRVPGAPGKELAVGDEVRVLGVREE